MVTWWFVLTNFSVALFEESSLFLTVFLPTLGILFMCLGVKCNCLLFKGNPAEMMLAK